jgi:hypothetical protein
MLEQQLPDLESAALARIQSARSLQDLEQVRIEVLGRKGTLAQVSKEMGKVPPEDRVRRPSNSASMPSGSISPSPHPARGSAICIPSRRSNPKSKTCSFRWASPFSMGPRWKTNIIISTR